MDVEFGAREERAHSKKESVPHCTSESLDLMAGGQVNIGLWPTSYLVVRENDDGDGGDHTPTGERSTSTRTKQCSTLQHVVPHRRQSSVRVKRRATVFMKAHWVRRENPIDRTVFPFFCHFPSSLTLRHCLSALGAAGGNGVRPRRRGSTLTLRGRTRRCLLHKG